jgi:hypothetical protein
MFLIKFWILAEVLPRESGGGNGKKERDKERANLSSN